MEIEVSDHDGVLAIAPQGRLDSNSAPELEELLLGRIESGNKKMIVDFSAIHYVSSAGLRVLLMAAKRTRAANGSFAIHSMSDTCLLYTSPSPRDRQKSRMPSSA